MKFLRMRFTVRRLMVAVAIVSLPLGWWRYREMAALSERYRQKYGWYYGLATLDLGEAEEWDQMAVEKRKSAAQHPAWTLDQMAVASAGKRRMGNYYRDLASKYARAVARPWLPVAPDPPEPE
jgi:hypothetical protein